MSRRSRARRRVGRAVSFRSLKARRAGGRMPWPAARRAGAVLSRRAPARRDAAAERALRGGVSRHRLLGGGRGRGAGRRWPRWRADRAEAQIEARDLRHRPRRRTARPRDNRSWARPAVDRRHRAGRCGVAHARGERAVGSGERYRRLRPLSRSARPAIAGKTRHAGTLGAETERARLALDLAASGKNVALVSSGDSGIYGLAALVFELIDRDGAATGRRSRSSSRPG